MLVAGIDIGNATTEVLLAEDARPGARPVITRRCRTSGQKGSRESLETAARLLHRAERALGSRCSRVAIARLQPVVTLAAEIPRPAGETSPLRDLHQEQAATPFGIGFAIGVSVPIAALRDAAPGAPLIVSVPTGVDFEEAAAMLSAGQARGLRIEGVVVAGDDAVLIGNRMPISVPIVDEAEVDWLVPGEVVAIEVRPAGETLRVLSDPVALAGAFALPPDSIHSLAHLCRRLADARCAALISRDSAIEAGNPAEEAWIEFDRVDGRGRLPLSSSPGQLSRAIRPGSVRRMELPAGSALAALLMGAESQLSDFFAVDLPALERAFLPRAGSIDLTKVPFSLLVAPKGSTDQTCSIIEAAAGRPVREVMAEPDAAACGSLTTPGSSPDAAVCDLGGGTIHLVWREDCVTAAGAGELLTLATALALGVPNRLAEYVKRSAAFRAEAPHVVRYEDGSTAFIGEALRSEVLGQLCTQVGRRITAFSDTLTPGEWRSLRLAIKRQVIGANVSRCLDVLPETPRTLLLCGGAALDAESVRIVGESVGELGVSVGRANVAGQLGPRYAVAYGLAKAALAPNRLGSPSPLSCPDSFG